MATIHHDQQTHPSGTPPSLEGFEGCSHSAPGENNVVDKKHIPTLDPDGHLRRLNQTGSYPIQIVTMKGGIQCTTINLVTA